MDLKKQIEVAVNIRTGGGGSGDDNNSCSRRAQGCTTRSMT